MKNQDFTTSFSVDRTTHEVFSAINRPQEWWSEEITGNTGKLNDEFHYHFRDVHICRMRLTEVIPDQKVVWLVLENSFNFIKDQSEWVGTSISFEINEENGRTNVRFTHHGLVPACECYEICENAWTQYIRESLVSLIKTGKGQPNSKETPRTEYEKALG